MAYNGLGIPTLEIHRHLVCQNSIAFILFHFKFYFYFLIIIINTARRGKEVPMIIKQDSDKLLRKYNDKACI